MNKETTSTLAPPAPGETSLLTEQDLHLFNEGTHYRIYDKLGAHITMAGGKAGAYFGVWAPNASTVSVVGDFWRRSGRDGFGSELSPMFTGFRTFPESIATATAKAPRIHLSLKPSGERGLCLTRRLG